MPLVADGWDTIWEERWPINKCEGIAHGLHDMQKTGALIQCVNCGRWLDVQEEPAYLAAAFRITGLLNDRHRQN